MNIAGGAIPGRKSIIPSRSIAGSMMASRSAALASVSGLGRGSRRCGRPSH